MTSSLAGLGLLAMFRGMSGTAGGALLSWGF